MPHEFVTLKVSQGIKQCTLGLLALAGLFLCPIAKAADLSTALREVNITEPGVFFQDEQDLESLKVAVDQQKKVWRFISESKWQEPYFSVGTRAYSRRDLLHSYDLLLNLLEHTRNPRILDQQIRQNFQIFQMRGQDDDGRVLLTAYYAPVLRGSLKRTSTYRYPIYQTPKNLLRADLSAFPASADVSLKGITSRLQGQTLSTYYTRDDIDHGPPIAGLKPLAFVATDLDRFFLQVQGSGTLILENGQRFPVSYDAQNGHAYVGIGKEMVKDELMAPHEQSMQMIRLILDEDEDLRRDYTSRNPSYVFFRKGNVWPQGSSGAFLTTRRSVATDTKLFPKGGLVFLRHRLPAHNREQRKTWVDSSTFLIDQDTGGAIKGAGRLDMFLGEGDWAANTAGEFAHYGAVYYIVRK